MKCRILILCLIVICFQLQAQYPGPNPQDVPDNFFASPVKHTQKLGGNFAELRNNHFHAGIDIKSKKGVIGDSIFAVADGYLRRVKVQRSSYGQTLYIDHPEVALTSVYAHLDKFEAEIHAYVRDQQWKQEKFEIDLYPEADRFPIKKGDYIGKMGNKGHSYGPHLHFELRTLTSEIPVNPMFFGFGPDDTKPPVFTGVKVHGIGPNKTPEKGKRLKLLKIGSNKYSAEDISIQAWQAGVSVGVYDQQNGSYNKNGVYELTLLAEGDTLYSFAASHCSFDETRQINAHVDYTERVYRNTFLHRCFQLPGNTLSMYRKITKNGFIPLFENRPTKIEVFATDWHGNTTQLEFNVARSPETPSGEARAFHTLFHPEKANIFSLGDFTLSSDSFSAYHHHEIKLTYSLDHKNELNNLTIGKPEFALKRPYSLTIPSIYFDSVKLSKAHLLILDERKNIWKSQGSPLIDDHRVTFELNALGKMKIGYDLVAPVIKKISIPKSIEAGAVLKFTIKDDVNPSRKRDHLQFKVTMNEKWIYHEFDAKNHLLIVPIPPQTKIIDPKVLKIQASDFVGNTSQLIMNL